MHSINGIHLTKFPLGSRDLQNEILSFIFTKQNYHEKNIENNARNTEKGCFAHFIYALFFLSSFLR